VFAVVLKGKVTVATQPLVGTERDEITALVSRLKQADDNTRKATTGVNSPQVQAADLKWAEDWQLPSEVFEYFVLERAA
jgi:hypothetical protein